MERNVGEVDRIVRIVVGVVLLAWAIAFDGPSWTWIGVLPLATGLLRWCPGYTIFGSSTCAKSGGK